MNDKTEYRFSSEHRLKTKSDFAYLKESSSINSAPFLKVIFKKSNKSARQTRIGFAISRKVGPANKRNRLKRLLKEQFRQSEYKNNGLDCLFVVYPSLLKKINTQKHAEKILENSFIKLLKELPR